MDKTVEHMQLSDMPGFCGSIQKWLGERYGKAGAAQICVITAWWEVKTRWRRSMKL